MVPGSCKSLWFSTQEWTRDIRNQIPTMDGLVNREVLVISLDNISAVEKGYSAGLS